MECRNVAMAVSEALNHCGLLLKADVDSEWRRTVRAALLSLGSAVGAELADSSHACAGNTFQAALSLSIAAMQCGVKIGDSVVVRQAAHQVCSLCFEAADWLVHMQSNSGEGREVQGGASRPLKRQRIHQYADAHGMAFSICAAAVPLCSGMSVFFLYQLRSLQRTDGNDVDALGAIGPCISHASDVTKYTDGSWLSDLPSDVTVAWVQLDRSRQVLQISRKVDGPFVGKVDSPIVTWRVPLKSSAFEELETEFQDLQREHHVNVSSFVQKEDCSSMEQRRVFWKARERVNCQIERLAVNLQADLLQEWRFLLMPWAQQVDAQSCASSEFKSWWTSEAAMVNLHVYLPEGSSCWWMLSLLYWAAGQMDHGEVSCVLASLMRPVLTSACELDSLGKSMQGHRAAASAVPPSSSGSSTRSPLLLFVDSDVAQFPLESCPCLRTLEVVRGIAPNVTLTAFQRQRGGREARKCMQGTLATGTADSSTSSPRESSMLHRGPPQGGFFILDPLKDPGCSQGQLQNLLHSLNASREHGTWAGYVGKPFPESSELLSKLGTEDVFLYMGHGQCARKLLKPEALQMGAPVKPGSDKGGPKCVPLHSVVMLMGCSTAKMCRAMPSTAQSTHAGWRSHTRTGSEFEGFGMPLNVLIGGAPAMVGALWDVLAGDLEQLACSLLKGWVVGSRSQKLSPMSLAAALVKAREACKLRFLTGAAVVCYGIPI